MIFFLTTRHVVSTLHRICWSLSLSYFSTSDSISCWTWRLCIISIKTTQCTPASHWVTSWGSPIRYLVTQHRWKRVRSRWWISIPYKKSKNMWCDRCFEAKTYSFDILFYHPLSRQEHEDKKDDWISRDNVPQDLGFWKVPTPCVDCRENSEGSHHDQILSWMDQCDEQVLDQLF